MEIKDSFRVSTSIEDTWKVLLDIEQVAPCLPGAQLEEIDGDEFRGNVKVKVGPITAQYKGTAKFSEIDEAAHRLVIDATGRDTRGQGNAKAAVVVTMTAEGAGTRVEVVTDLSITGKVAQFGRGVLADVSSKLMGQFVENLERDVLAQAGGGDTSGAGGPYEHALEAAVANAPASSPPSAPSSTTPGAASASVATQTQAGPRRIESREVEPVDLLGVAGAPVTKRLIPVGVAALVLFVLWRILRKRG